MVCVTATIQPQSECDHITPVNQTNNLMEIFRFWFRVIKVKRLQKHTVLII